MYLRVFYFFKILWQDIQNMLLCLIASYFTPKMFAIIWINKSVKTMTSNFNFLLKSFESVLAALLYKNPAL